MLPSMFRITGIFLGLLLLCSCATMPKPRVVVPATDLPTDVDMNTDAGAGGPLIVQIKLDDGRELPFALDTGASGTAFDKSLEPTLGKRAHTVTLWRWGRKERTGIYISPTLHLGKTPLLMTGPYVATSDFHELPHGSEPPIEGVLGMDVLEHYCFQLDFAAKKIRFLDSSQADKSGWGQPFPVTENREHIYRIDGNLSGIKGSGSMIDTGCNFDGWLLSTLFDQWTNQAAPPADGAVRYPNAMFGGETYPDMLHVHRLSPELSQSSDLHMRTSGLGLHFLARHLVTFDFPRHTMYLKRTTTEPPSPDGADDALAFLKSLREKSGLPGWPKEDPAVVHLEPFAFPDPQSIVFTVVKEGDPTLYHYTIARESEGSAWKLKKAYRSNPGNDTIEEYAVP